MRRFTLIPIAMLALRPELVAAQDWQRLDGAGVTQALTGAKVTYKSGATQDFRASGRTMYHAGSDSWGNWRVESDQYCSQWPPSDLWACYDLEVAGDRLQFIGSTGDITGGVFHQ